MMCGCGCCCVFFCFVVVFGVDNVLCVVMMFVVYVVDVVYCV